MKQAWERIYNGLIKENPTFVLMLGMCATLAVTTKAVNGLGMGLSTAVVLVLSNMMISLLRKVIPDSVRMPAYIVVIASFVTIVQMLIQAYVPTLYDSLGIFIPLIVVNCIILGRAEAYASKNSVFLSVFDGIGMGLGFTASLTVIGAVRELFGSGTIFDVKIMPSAYQPIGILVLAPGAFFVLALLNALMKKLKVQKGPDMTQGSDLACGGNCAACGGCAGAANHQLVAQQAAEKARLAAEAKKKAAEAAKQAAEAKKAAEAAKSAEAEKGGEQA